MLPSFGKRLSQALAQRAPLCVGVDPSAQLLAKWGLSDDASGLATFGAAVLDAVEGLVAVVKPQSAFFERHGSAGIAALERLCDDAQARGLLVLLDAKRGDIGTTSQAYAEAYLSERSPLRIDAMTVTPYLGVGALAPMFEVAAASGRGLFVVARSSNPEGAPIQDARVEGGLDVVGHVLGEVARANAGADGLGSIGVVFGATCETSGYDLRGFGGPILAPGLGAQGATVDDIARRFAGYADRVLPAVSRAVLSAGPDVTSMRAAAAELATACREALR
ncbi:MAG TPA: orotidine-5'-phosphate decarboxylase [Acidothermaceae bacterium]|nr:orotidine-5'-phosphate decarboxylase [Acidothermaceae bacterium]